MLLCALLSWTLTERLRKEKGVFCLSEILIEREHGELEPGFVVSRQERTMTSDEVDEATGGLVSAMEICLDYSKIMTSDYQCFLDSVPPILMSIQFGEHDWYKLHVDGDGAAHVTPQPTIFGFSVAWLHVHLAMGTPAFFGLRDSLCLCLCPLPCGTVLTPLFFSIPTSLLIILFALWPVLVQ